MFAGKLILAVFGSGSVLGALAGLAVDPTMKPPPDPPWEPASSAQLTSRSSWTFVDRGPEDLSPPTAQSWPAAPLPKWARSYVPPYDVELASVSEPVPEVAAVDVGADQSPALPAIEADLEPAPQTAAIIHPEAEPAEAAAPLIEISLSSPG